MGWNPLSRRRALRQVWADPERTILTLESFARTETDGAADIARAASRTVDPWLRDHLERHAEDERRHGDMFRELARTRRAARPRTPAAGVAIPFDLTRGRPDGEDSVNAHGFLETDRYDDFQDVPFVAMLHVAEKKAASLFEVQHELTGHLPDVQAAFRTILKDEQYHVSYTRSALERFREQGRGREVSRALKAASEARLLGSWKRLGARATGNLGRLLLFVAYFTVCAPFALASRRQTDDGGFRDPRVPDPSATLGSQYR